jgi:hypothetical protein
MVPTYNGWEDTPEDEREALELWEARDRTARRSSRAIARPDLGITGDDWSIPASS